jgi:hypothetical protein
MSLDASSLLEELTRIQMRKVTGSRLLAVEMFSRGYGKMTAYLMGENGSLMMQAFMICIISLRGSPLSRKRESNYQASRILRKPNQKVSSAECLAANEADS